MITSTEGMDYCRRADANTANLHELKAGDEVVVRSRYGDSRDIRVVERVTPALVVVAGTKYYKDGGKEFGVGSDRYYSSLDTFVAEERVRREKQLRFGRALNGVKGISWERQPVEVLEAIGDLLAGKDKPLRSGLVAADWKDMEGLIDGFQLVLGGLFGIVCTAHPDFEGSDTYGIIVSNRDLTEDELKAQSIDELQLSE